PEALRPGDIICVLFGAAVPFMLRPQEHYFLLVGECYIHELMDGHVIRLRRGGGGVKRSSKTENLRYIDAMLLNRLRFSKSTLYCRCFGIFRLQGQQDFLPFFHA
ncbi:hypothetical protein BU26DRAFT_429086, partial [Trematosphaeria pertusa]